MKSLFFILLTTFSISAMAVAPLAKMENVNGNIAITVSDFGDAGAFEKYKCHVDFGSWVYHMDAFGFGGDKYRCLDQGVLQSGVAYDVYFTFKEWPTDYESQTATFTLKAN